MAEPHERENIFRGFANSPPLYFRDTRDGLDLYRTSPNRLEQFNTQAFPAHKAPGTVRIFTIGGSTTFGEPWGHQGSYSHFLESALSTRFPDRLFEVINAGGKGYGSTANLETVREALGYEPDAFVLFVGHNEFREETFYPRERSGASTIPPWKAALESHSRIFAVLRRGVERAVPRRGVEPTSYATRQIAEILARPFGPESFRFPTRLAIPPVQPGEVDDARVVGRFRGNLRAMVDAAAERSIPCFLMTVVRNEAFWLLPNRSELRAGVSALYPVRYTELLDSVASGDYPGALARIAAVRDLYAVDDDRYLRALEGDLHLALGRPAEARAAFGLIWPEDRINATIRAVGNATQSCVVECDRIARAVAPDSVLGFGVFYDELHPTPQIHRALGIALADSIASLGVGGLRTEASLPDDAAAYALPDSATAEVFAYEAVRALYLGDDARVEAMAESALVRAPDFGKPIVYRGICAQRRGDHATARASWDALARLYPQMMPSAKPGKPSRQKQNGASEEDAPQIRADGG
ncbi:MAG: hypothetical protein ACKVU1_09555 [bacterium]